MDIYIFTDDKKTMSLFSSLEKSRDFNVIIKPVNEYKNIIKNLEQCELVYLDILNFKDDAEIRRNLNYIQKYKKIRCGIIDTKNRLTGIAHYFHQGFCDYINSTEIHKPVTVQRINEVYDFKTCDFNIKNDSRTEHLVHEKTQGKELSWNEISEGNEYSFLLMYIRLDRQKKLKSEFGYDFIEKMTEKFEKYIEHLSGMNNGKLWNWDVNNGIILYPYSDSSCSNVITASYRFMRDTILLSNEILNSPVKLDFTIILEKGEMEYHARGMTGTTISEALNRIFHAADLMAEPGNLYIFDSLFKNIPHQINHLYVETDDFEGHGLKRLKKYNI
ncbi:MAG: hypothetical protein JW982_14130 [Spirochaetes bacterium]|nr:hypothetical protein [Spirochaetota bacterium]